MNSVNKQKYKIFEMGEGVMSPASVPVALEVLYTLDLIMKFLQDQGEPVSKTKIRNWLKLTDEGTIAALDYGCANGNLSRELYNSYKIKKDFSILEERFYPAVQIGIEKLWKAQKYESNEFYIEETARKDSKIAGPWTRPDFTLVSHKRFPWTIGYEFDVVTFEVKRPDTSNVLAVFEALSHASAATRAYVVFPIDADAWSEVDPEQEARVKDECSKHGVGLILIENIYQNPSPLHVIKARKQEIDHEKCSDFLSAVMSDQGKQKISQWK